ncbi:potassium transporter [Sorangium cellulosum]|uniref:Putative K(+)-stimulated pyrophosphate-energized sodium pump n=2 Tax=Sorangium cellulosum TaxID=56 RepID=A0A4P2PZB7_SORCE|nr:sodium-translocating pyrophosphatase [Sorangium cellulosum]AUX21853.1 potassium transporter [Sorangium cellulosum]
MDALSYQSIATGAVALMVARVFYVRVKKAPEGNETMARIARYVREGAMAFLAREYKVLAIYAVVVFALLAATLGLLAAGAFAAGAFLSLIAGFFGMKAATYANVRTAEAARAHGKPTALVTALDGGAVMGLCVAGLGLIGLGGIYALFRNDEHLATIVHSFAVGASSIALFARIGGGIYTKAADVGADIVGKVEANIPEDDPRNPGVIADNVGDNVGDIAGMGADIYESYVAAVVAAIALGLTMPIATLQQLAPSMGETELRAMAVSLPLLLATIGLAVSVVGIFITRALKNLPPARVLRLALILPPFLVVLAAAAVLPQLGFSFGAVVTLAAGAAGGAIVGLVTDYYTSMGPIHKVAQSSLTGPGTNVIRGLAVGLESVAIPLLVLCAVGWISNHYLGLYGIALAAVGMLAGTAIVMTVDAYGPIADNGGGISEMAGLGKEVREITDELDAVGNTTAAVGKGFAIGSAVLTVVALFAAFNMEVDAVRRAKGLPELVLYLTDAKVLMGLLFGALLPCLVGALTMTAVGRAAGSIVEEIRRQFREIPGLLEGKPGVDPQPKVIVDIATSAAIREMIAPGAIAVLAPVLVGFVAGPEVLAGTLAGALVVGAVLSLMMANGGGAWDNAKKHIEKGGLAGHAKGSDAHKAAVVGDTVGDPFKDTSGPGISILIKVMGVVSLLIAPLIA